MENLETYIQSGILESYVNGLLSETEMREVDAMAAKHPEVDAEIEAIQQALRAYGDARTEGPRMPALDAILATSELAGTDDPKPAEEEAERSRSVPKSWLRNNWLVAASWGGLLISGTLAIYFYLQNQQLAAELNSVRQAQAYAEAQYRSRLQAPQAIANARKVLQDSALTQVTLTGLPAHPEARAMVYWHLPTRDVYLHIHELPSPPEGHQYQLWAIIDGVSVDAGIFDHHKQLQKLRNVRGSVSGFAVTLEKTGGRPVPSLDRMYAKGLVQG